jgi:hypothetical protein
MESRAEFDGKSGVDENSKRAQTLSAIKTATKDKKDEGLLPARHACGLLHLDPTMHSQRPDNYRIRTD